MLYYISLRFRNDYLSVHIEGEGFFSVKTVDAGLWVAEFEMDCDKTTDGWFEYKVRTLWVTLL